MKIGMGLERNPGVNQEGMLNGETKSSQKNVLGFERNPRVYAQCPSGTVGNGESGSGDRTPQKAVNKGQNCKTPRNSFLWVLR